MPGEQRVAVLVLWCGDHYEARIAGGWYSGRDYPTDGTYKARRAARGKAIRRALKSLEREL